MALILKNTMDRPFGQFDLLDATYKTGVRGGEVMTWTSVTEPSGGGTDEASADVNEDGYAYNKTRPAVTFATSATAFPLFLSDDGGISGPGYGTLLGAVVGGQVGQQANGPFSYTGAVLGPGTWAGSGKCTLWNQAGLYGATLDAVDTATNGVVPTNTNCTVGAALSYTSVGLLTPNVGGNKISAAPVVAYMTEFQTTGSLVTSQQFMVAALNSPSGDVSSLVQQTFYQVEFYFLGPAA
jgi:hypothetical protein